LAEEQKYLKGPQPDNTTTNNSTNNGNHNSDNVTGKAFGAENRTFERYRLHVENNNNETEKSKGPSITVVGVNGQVKQFNNLDEYEKHGLDKRIDKTVNLRTNRNEIFKDSNPWTYTAEEAAQLGLLPEIPKDYDKKSQEKN